MKVWLNRALGCNHQSIHMPRLHPLCSAYDIVEFMRSKEIVYCVSRNLKKIRFLCKEKVFISKQICMLIFETEDQFMHSIQLYYIYRCL